MSVSLQFYDASPVLISAQHCRKCGGVFCHRCTAKLTHLLDVSNLDFLHPPRHVPISVFDSPTSPVSLEKVCDECWDQMHGSPRTPDTRPSTPMLVASASSTASPSPTSSICASPIEQSALSARAVRVKRSSSQLSARQFPFPSAVAVSSDLEPAEPSYGELDAYPLRRSSVICKATGGGRWEPKNSPPRIGFRIPGCKALYELEMEREDAEERRRRTNPIVRDGGQSTNPFRPSLVTRTHFSIFIHRLPVQIPAGPESPGEPHLPKPLPIVHLLALFRLLFPKLYSLVVLDDALVHTLVVYPLCFASGSGLSVNYLPPFSILYPSCLSLMRRPMPLL